MALEQLAELVRVDRPAELVGEDRVLILVGVGGEVPLEQLRVAVGAEGFNGLGIERDRAP